MFIYFYSLELIAKQKEQAIRARIHQDMPKDVEQQTF